MSADIGARFVACKGWWWMPGMVTLPFCDEDGEPSHPPWWLDDGMRWPGADLEEDALPDTGSPATLGCIEHGLLPEAWPGCHIVVSRWPTDGGTRASVRIMDNRSELAFAIIDFPLAEALLAALEASPANQEGAR